MKKFEITEKTVEVEGITFYRIRALRDIGDSVSVGDLGGFVEKEENLSQEEPSWIFGDARVSGDAEIFSKMILNGKIFIVETPYSANRSDGYTFTLLYDENKNVFLTAGCRVFTFSETKEHWEKTRGGTKLGAETMAIIKFLETCHELEIN